MPTADGKHDSAVIDPQSNRPAVGREVDGVQLDEQLDTQGWKDSYKGWSVEEAGAVFIKLYRLPEAAGDQAFLDELTAYIERLNALKLPGLARIVDFGTYSDSVYIVTDWFEAGNLTKWLAEGRERTLDEIRDICTSVLEVLRRLHEAGLAHGNLKTSNVLFGANLRPVISDPALPCLWSRLEGGQTISEFSAPEQHLTPFLVGPEQDVFSFGNIAFRMLTGRSFSFSGFELPSRVRSDVGPEWDVLVERSTRHGAARRFANGGEALAVLAPRRAVFTEAPAASPPLACPKCGAVSPAGSERCTACSASFAAAEKRLCPRCHQPVPEGAVKCPSCGFDERGYRSDASRRLSDLFKQAQQLEEEGQFEAAIARLQEASVISGQGADSRAMVESRIEEVRRHAREGIFESLREITAYIDSGSLSNALRALEQLPEEDVQVRDVKKVCIERMAAVRELLERAVDASMAGRIADVLDLTARARKAWNDSEVVNAISREVSTAVEQSGAAQMARLLRAARKEFERDRFQAARLIIEQALALNVADPELLKLLDEFKHTRARRSFLGNLLEGKRKLLAGDESGAMNSLLEASRWLQKGTPASNDLVEMIRMIDARQIEIDRSEFEDQWRRVQPYETNRPQSIHELIIMDNPEHASSIFKAVEGAFDDEESPASSDRQGIGRAGAGADSSDRLAAIRRGFHTPEARQKEEALDRLRSAKPPAARAGGGRKTLADALILGVVGAAIVVILVVYLLRGGGSRPAPAPAPSPSPPAELPSLPGP